MWFWWYMLACDLLIPAVMIIAGFIMQKHSPKKINAFLGFRTRRSMMNMDTWKFAHAHCGKLWWKIGLCMTVPSVLVNIPFYNGKESVISVVGLAICTLQLVVLAVSVIPTQMALKRNFNDDGTRKTI